MSVQRCVVAHIRILEHRNKQTNEEKEKTRNTILTMEFVSLMSLPGILFFLNPSDCLCL